MAGTNARQVKEGDNTKLITLTESDDTYDFPVKIGGDKKYLQTFLFLVTMWREV